MRHSFLKKGFHYPVSRCEQNMMIFLLKGTLLVNSKEYAGVTMKEGQFILQGIGSKLEVLAMTDVECIVYRFNQPILICEEKYNNAIQTAILPLIYAPLDILPPLNYYLTSVSTYVDDEVMCGKLFDMKQKELNIILSSYYSDRELATLYHSISFYTTSFHYFVMRNYEKAKTVEDLAHLGGYNVNTFRRIFKNMFNEPAYEWMLKRRSEAIKDDLTQNDIPISEICARHGFDSFSHFSNFCRTNLGDSPRAIRKESEDNCK